MSKLNFDIGIVIPDLGGGGTQRVLLNLVRAWLQHNKKICVITFSSEEADFFKLPETISRKCVNHIKESNGFWDAIWHTLKRVKALRSLIYENYPACILSFLNITNMLTLLATRGMNIPVIISERSDPVKEYLSIRWSLLRYFLYRQADVVTANSYDAIRFLGKFVNSKKLKYVPNPVSIEKKLPLLKYNFPVILAVGRLVYEKGYDILLRAFAKFIYLYPTWRLVIVGDGKLGKDLQKLALSLCLTNDVIWCGMRFDVFCYYKAATIFVMPSRYEGTPNALLEAMGSGLPVIVSNASSGLLEFVKNGETGLVVPTEDTEALCTAFIHLAENKSLRQRLGSAARQRVEIVNQSAYHTWDSIIDKAVPGWTPFPK
ncbi:MAG: glycosyltransferase [Coxiella endosymbiont of Haemaphysalis qinghaiensis]